MFTQKAVGVVVFLIIFVGLVWWVSGVDFSPTNVEPSNTVVQEEEVPADDELPALQLSERVVMFSDGTKEVFRVAEPFDIAISAEGLGKARFMAMSPDGRLFVPDMVDYKLSHEGKLYILDDYNSETRQFETKHTYLSGLRGPNSVAFYTDAEGNDWLYLALTTHLLRYPYREGDTTPSGEPEVVYEFPNEQSPGEVSVVWHVTRTLLFKDDTLYISVGSGCNSCEHLAGDLRGMVVAMNPDGTNARMYADGLRNSVGIEWALGSVFATNNGADHLGEDRPDETLYRLSEGTHYGWPFCYESEGSMHNDTTSLWDDTIECADVPRPLATFEARSAPLGIAFFEEGHMAFKGAFLVALHGSFNPELRKGYEIVRVSQEGKTAVFMDGFQKEDGSRTARPVDIFQYTEDSFFFTDDFYGRLYLVYARD
ncbi:glucose/sorbosone dehydrogenase [Candidatus Kaiserbacteria bacterium CG10_big_fil_rev_8_21_14_0_10_45_20]|uniref:Glucose/sorbosone dehydrogenase n=1 Tax=Candidatus Kaiserbacteria bacterium CG10_big_fil_rev_8_21_14_0_10_45_20 TaxID=1974607 RepID=A0A2H0UFD3_9BACT|nr:MAG: glucose/sorbosone dehydrogenase [Candidatus Kaiserbacteria bacterium CG10_big_fil_rev_8_21_14_0_10_45_20]